MAVWLAVWLAALFDWWNWIGLKTFIPFHFIQSAAIKQSHQTAAIKLGTLIACFAAIWFSCWFAFRIGARKQTTTTTEFKLSSKQSNHSILIPAQFRLICCCWLVHCFLAPKHPQWSQSNKSTEWREWNGLNSALVSFISFSQLSLYCYNISFAASI